MESTEREKTILDQYKLYVEMTDRVSARRAGANQFFITVLGAGLAVSTLTLSQVKSSQLQSATLIIFSIFGIVICGLWDGILVSYRQLNSAKFKVIHNMEQQLPFKPYHDEWDKAGRGKDPKLYTPLTRVEQYVPRILLIPYVLLFVLGIMSAFGAIH